MANRGLDTGGRVPRIAQAPFCFRSVNKSVA